MIGILGGMGTQAGLDFCNKLAILYRGKIDQDYPLFLLYNKSNIPSRPESIGIQTRNLSTKIKRLSIETGAGDFFIPARKLFKKTGFTVCEPFAHYKEDINSVYLTMLIDDI